jgi:hypothetical protein
MTKLTLFGTLEADVELLHVVVDQRYFVIAHQHLHDVRLDSALWTGHFGLCVIVLFLRGGGMVWETSRWGDCLVRQAAQAVAGFCDLWSVECLGMVFLKMAT